MALTQELDFSGLILPASYRKIDKVSVDVIGKAAEVFVSIYVSEEAKKEKKWAISNAQVVFQNKAWTLLNTAFLEDGSPKPNPAIEDWHILPITDFDSFMKAKGRNIFEQAYNACKERPEFKNAKDA